MTAARHYWNASCPLLSQPIERELLREPIRIILQCITDTAEKLKKKEVCIIWAPTRENLSSGFANNTGTDQPAHTRSLISAFVILLLESIISRLATSKISMF